MRGHRRFALVGLLILDVSALAATAAPPRRVLVLHSLGRGLEPHATLAAAFRAAVFEDPREPMALQEMTLETALDAGPATESLFVDYLARLDARGHRDLVVAIGGAAAQFVQRNRGRVFVSTPLLIAGVDSRLVKPGALTPLDAVVPARLDLGGAYRNVFDLLPDTTNLVVVLGRLPLEEWWEGEFLRAFQPYASRARLTFYDALPYSEMLKRAATLPPRSAILYASFMADGEGTPHPDDAALTDIRSVTPAPVFGIFAHQLGRGIVGGPLVSAEEAGRQAASVAKRILRGESPARLRLAPIEAGTPSFDWRELTRWHIDSSRLPAGSVVRFRPPGFWEENRWTILGFSGIAAAEAALIAVLLLSLVARRRAEERLRRSEEQYALAVEGANDGLWDWNVRTGEVYLSPRCQAMLGHDEPGLPQQVETWQERIHPDEKERVLQMLRSHLEGRDPAYQAELRLRRRDGDYRWFLARGKALRDRDGKPYRMAGSLTDISGRRLAEEAMRGLGGRLILAQEEERARLARELHDDVTQRLARLAIDTARAERGGPGDSLAEAMRGIREGLVRLSEDVHALSYRLHPSLLDDLGLAEALRAECDRFRAASPMVARLELGDVPERIPNDVAICLFRVAQEALRNVERHAGALSVEVSLRSLDGGLQLAVHDDGVGFDSTAGAGERTLGHSSMRERVRLLSGELDIESRPGQGTLIMAWVPLGDSRR